jgi:hypothetical protein
MAATVVTGVRLQGVHSVYQGRLRWEAYVVWMIPLKEECRGPGSFAF